MSGRGIDSSRCQRRCVRPLIVDDVETVVRAGIDSIGVAFVSDERVMPQLESGELIPLLEDWCQPFPGFFLYYPSRRQQQTALSDLINALRL
jgi:DNA-binding transcriptional LysR family regulator